MTKLAEQIFEKIASGAMEIGYMMEMDEISKEAAYGMETAKTLYGKGVKFMGDVTGKTLSKAKDTYNRAEAASRGAIFSRISKKQMSEAAKLDKYKAMLDHEIAVNEAKNIGMIGAGVAGAAGIGKAISALSRRAAKKGMPIVNRGIRKKLLIGGGAAAGLGGAYALVRKNREQNEGI